MNTKKLLNLVIILVTIPLLSGCFLAVAAGAGAYGGFKMKEKGYTIQSPIAKEKKQQSKKFK